MFYPFEWLGDEVDISISGIEPAVDVLGFEVGNFCDAHEDIAFYRGEAGFGDGQHRFHILNGPRYLVI